MTCVTAVRTGLKPTSLVIHNSNVGYFINEGYTFRYVSLWDDADTWDGDFEPLEGESVYVPTGLNLLVNVDSTPLLNAVIVEGSLTFPSGPTPAHERTFDAHYVFVREGLFEVGTEEDPYTSKLTITMHGNKESAEIPIYGNKVIAVQRGIIDLHGQAKTPTWTTIASTAAVDATTITLSEDVTNWNIGDEIVIAPTNYFSNETEKRTITAVSGRVLTLDSPLKYSHYSGV